MLKFDSSRLRSSPALALQPIPAALMHRVALWPSIESETKTESGIETQRKSAQREEVAC
jgi:hypothetical protein